jgi:mannose-6-phosphate isomerase-like protein (cupin superfamily)
MKISSLAEMTGGWFVGDFEPTCWRTGKFEVACKEYRKGDSEAAHVHRVATEITLIVRGRARMNGRDLPAGAVVLLEPGEAATFAALEDTITVVVKIPSSPGDKYAV